MKTKHCILHWLIIVLFQACCTVGYSRTTISPYRYSTSSYRYSTPRYPYASTRYRYSTPGPFQFTSRLPFGPCETPTQPSGNISFSVDYVKNFYKCWHIKATEESYVKLDLIESRLNDPYCMYMYLEIVEENAGHSSKICQYDYYNKVNWTQTIIGGVTIRLTIRDSWKDHLSFKMKYHTESITCLRKYHFRCSENQCIRPDQVCDGIENCDNGSDEAECELLRIRGVSESRQKAIDWLKRRQTDFGWGKNTHRAITALYLTDEAKFQGNKIEEEAIVKELELRTAMSLLRHSSDSLSANELSMYVNALSVTCHNYRNFFGNDLLKMLATRTFSSSSPSPGAFLTLCNAGWSFSVDNVQQLLNILTRDSDYPFVFEIQAMTVMALSCIQKKVTFNHHLDDIAAIYNKTLQNFLAHQNPDGSFGNAHTTAMVTQALLSSGQIGKESQITENAIKFLMKNLNTSMDFLSVYLTLPLFKGNTLLDIDNVNCSEYKRRHGKDDDITDVLEKLGGNTTVQYSLYIGDDKNVIHTVYLKVKENSTAFDIMKIAQIADPKYKFSYHKMRDQVYVYEIAGLTNDMEAGKFWLLFTADSNKKTALRQSTESPDKIICNEHLILWYKSVDI